MMGVDTHPAVRAQGNPYLPHSLRGDATVLPFKQRQAPPAASEKGVPIGTAVQVLGWVADDPVRAQAALDRERTSDRPRVTLVDNLLAVLKRHGAAPQASGDVVALPKRAAAVDVVAAALEASAPAVVVDEGESVQGVIVGEVVATEE